MFHEIFRPIESRKVLPKIIVDVHEKNSLILSELISRKEAEIIIKPMIVGDYLVNNITIERKTNNDFISSMFNKRIFRQIESLKDSEHPLIIVEGGENIYLKDKSILNKYKGLILSIILKHRINILFTKDYRESSDYILLMSRKSKNSEMTLIAKKKMDKGSQKRLILETFPGIGPKKSRKLLERFKTLSNIINSESKELQDILGNNTKTFLDLINSEEF